MQTKKIKPQTLYKVKGRKQGSAKSFKRNTWMQIPLHFKDVKGIVISISEGTKDKPHLVQLDTTDEIIECTSNGILKELGTAGVAKNKMVDDFLDKVKAPKVSEDGAVDFVEGVEGLLEGFGVASQTVGDGDALKGIFIPYEACKPLHALIQEIFVESLKKGEL